MNARIDPSLNGTWVRYRPSRARRALFGRPLELVVTASYLAVGPTSIPLSGVLYAHLLERPPRPAYATLNASVAVLLISALIRGSVAPPYAIFGIACSVLAAVVWMVPQASLELRLYAEANAEANAGADAEAGPALVAPTRELSLAYLDGRRGPRLHASYRVWGRPRGLRAVARAIDAAIPEARLKAVKRKARPQDAGSPHDSRN